MKKIILMALCLCMLLSAAGCGAQKALLDESEYYVYQDGEVYWNPKDAIGEDGSSYLWFGDYSNSNLETKRGLKIGSTVTQVKELYGDCEIYSDADRAMTTVSEYLDQNSGTGEDLSIAIRCYTYDGKNHSEEEYIYDHQEFLDKLDQVNGQEKIDLEDKLYDFEGRVLDITIDQHTNNPKVSALMICYYTPEWFRNHVTEE